MMDNIGRKKMSAVGAAGAEVYTGASGKLSFELN
jgi:predicted Fe-Mo cluster-binding NifX family protein